jgi:phage gp46-like protein
MARDIKLNQDKGYFDIDFKNGDLELTDSLETSLYMSVLGEKRADESEVSNSIFRKGHFLKEFNKIAGYEIGSKLWLYIDQAQNIEKNKELIRGEIKESLKWLLEDNICKEINIETEISKEEIKIDIEIITGGGEETEYYSLFVNL